MENRIENHVESVSVCLLHWKFSLPWHTHPYIPSHRFWNCVAMWTKPHTLFPSNGGKWGCRDSIPVIIVILMVVVQTKCKSHMSPHSHSRQKSLLLQEISEPFFLFFYWFLSFFFSSNFTTYAHITCIILHTSEDWTRLHLICSQVEKQSSSGAKSVKYFIEITGIFYI